MIYVFTSILNGWDNLRPPCVPFDPNVRYICFTNLPNLPRVEQWEYRPIYDVGEACRSARVPKILPHLMLPEDAEYSIYHDGNFQLSFPPAAIIAGQLQSHDWAAHRHPCRSCIYDEAAVLLAENIGTSALVKEEIGRYSKDGYPVNAGLWANGLLIRRHTPAVARLNEAWWRLYSSGCERDQLSFPVARCSEGLEVKTIDGVIYQSPFMNFYWHAAWKDKPESRQFHAERNRLRGQLDQLKALTGASGGVNYPDF